MEYCALAQLRPIINTNDETANVEKSECELCKKGHSEMQTMWRIYRLGEINNDLLLNLATLLDSKPSVVTMLFDAND